MCRTSAFSYLSWAHSFSFYLFFSITRHHLTTGQFCLIHTSVYAVVLEIFLFLLFLQQTVDHYGLSYIYSSKDDPRWPLSVVTRIFFIAFGFEAGFPIAQVDPEFLILPPRPPKHWDYGPEPAHPAVALLLIALLTSWLANLKPLYLGSIQPRLQ